MQIKHNELIFFLNCCNEVLRGIHIEPDFETVFGETGVSQIKNLENILDKQVSENSEMIDITLDKENEQLLVKVIEVTIHELGWELSLRTNLDKEQAQALLHRFL
jgi:hypothetical protein